MKLIQKIIQMENSSIDATNNRPEGERKIDSPVLVIDIPRFISQIKDETTWEERNRNAITVFKTQSMRIVLVALHKDARMETQRPENVFSLQVLKGKVIVKTDFTTTEVDKEMMVALHDKISYTITALKKSIFLLTVVE